MNRLNILLIGSGGREHALAWRLRQSPLCGRLSCAPGNPGIAALPDVSCLPVPATDLARLCEVTRREGIDLVIVGPEAPLVAGLADAIAAETGAAVFGPSARAAEIEASKIFSKAFMQRHGIPTAAYAVVSSVDEAAAFLAAQEAAGLPSWVVKADGLCAGKGVTVCDDPRQALAAATALLTAGRGAQVVIEERLRGREASCMALCDGEHVLPLPACEDHKAIGDGDTGPMTGGMGAICPTPVVDQALQEQVLAQVLRPAARGLCAEGRPFHGLLYAGIMRTAQGPRVLEFNCRFGDPETQPLMMLLEEDPLPLLWAVARRELHRHAPRRLPLAGAAVCVVMAAAGYPGTPAIGDPITGITEAEALHKVAVFHAGTAADPLRTAGGRVLGVTALGETLPLARALAYRAVEQIHFKGAQVRRDIGARPDSIILP
jgi:phosphoribosylamine--glycine ligase